VVILDLCMPGGNGMDVLKTLRRDRLTPLLVVLTAYGERHYRKACLERGATFVFDKSIEFQKVAELLGNLASGGAKLSGCPDKNAEHAREGSATIVPWPGSGTTPPVGAPTTAETPRLVVSKTQKGEPVYYVCSRCLQGFPMPDIQPPKGAVQELCRRFQEHVLREYFPSADVISAAASAAA
jgi:hypothetical protein